MIAMKQYELDSTEKEAQQSEVMKEYPYLYRNRLRILWGCDSPYFGRRCRIVAHNRPKNTRLVEFDNGARAFVSGNSLRKVM